jgi:hypothetical protein
MANETKSTSVDELSAIAIAQAQFTAQNICDLTTLLTFRGLAAGEISARFPLFGKETAAALTEGNTIPNTEVTTTGVVLTPGMNATWGTTVSDMAASSAPQIFADIGRVSVQAVIAKKNADIFALFDGFSNQVGTTGVDISEATILAGVTQLRNQSALGEIFLVITPDVAQDLLTLYSSNTNNTAPGQREKAMAGEMPEIYGVTPIVCTSGISQVGDVKCGMFTREALGYVNQWGYKLEPQRENMQVGTAIAVSASYAVGEINDSLGVEVLVDGTDV